MGKKPLFFLAVIITVVCVLLLLIAEPMAYTTLLSTDFRAQYTGALMIRNGQTTDFYTLETQYRYQHSLAPQFVRVENLAPFITPPFVALMLLPLSFFALPTAYKIFGFFNLLLVGLISYALVKLSTGSENNKKFFSRYEILLLPLVFFPVWFTVLQSQFSFFFILSLLAGWYAVKEDRRFLGGLAMSILFIKPQLILLPVILFILKRQFRILSGLVTGGFILAVLSILLIGFEGIKKYPGFLLSLASQPTISAQFQPTLKGFLLFIFKTSTLTPPILSLYLFGIGGVILMCLYVFKGKWDTKKPLLDIQWGYMTAALIFVSPHTHNHDLSLLVVTFALFLRYVQASKVYKIHPTRLFILKNLIIFGVCIWGIIGVFWAPASALFLAIFLLALLQPAKTKSVSSKR